jgi:hypothetical protein
MQLIRIRCTSAVLDTGAQRVRGPRWDKVANDRPVMLIRPWLYGCRWNMQRLDPVSRPAQPPIARVGRASAGILRR